MARLVKDSGRYYLVGEGIYEDVTEAVESEVRARIELERKLIEYNQTVDSRVHFRAAAAQAQLATSQNHLHNLLDRAQATFDAWAHTGNPHGAMISLRPYLSIVKKWLDDTKDST